MEKIKLSIVAITHSVSSANNYAIILNEDFGSRRLPVIIGNFEAQAIAVAVENLNPNRPLTHDLFKNTLIEFNIKIEEVIINDLVEGIFFAQMICNQDGNISIIDSRTSDAIAMAVRFNAPIYTYESILEQAGVSVENEAVKDQDAAPVQRVRSSKNPLSSLSVNELEKMLDDVLKKEDYEKAAKIRDEIQRRGEKLS
jgi:bifunctional DNase/RNase